MARGPSGATRGRRMVGGESVRRLNSAPTENVGRRLGTLKERVTARHAPLRNARAAPQRKSGAAVRRVCPIGRRRNSNPGWSQSEWEKRLDSSPAGPHWSAPEFAGRKPIISCRSRTISSLKHGKNSASSAKPHRARVAKRDSTTTRLNGPRQLTA